MIEPTGHDCPFCGGASCPHCGGGEIDDREIGEAPTQPGLYGRVPEVIYHGDRASLSSTGARKLLEPGGPAKFVGEARRDSEDFDIGHAAHTLILGAGAELVEVKADNWSTKAAKEARAAARAEGKTPLLSKQLAAVHDMVAVALAHPEVKERLSGGRAEVSGYALHPRTWVMMRARPDYLRVVAPGAVEMDDYKTCADASPEGFAKSAANWGYHQQEAWYRAVWTELGWEVRRFVFIAQEKTPPYLVKLHEFGPKDIAVGHARNERALRLFVNCQDFDEWPGYGPAVNKLRLPRWARTAGEVIA